MSRNSAGCRGTRDDFCLKCEVRNDNQGIYNRMQQPDNEHLKLLLEYELGTDRGGPWFKRFWQDSPYRR